jgi:hypothetical protein
MRRAAGGGAGWVRIGSAAGLLSTGPLLTFNLCRPLHGCLPIAWIALRCCLQQTASAACVPASPCPPPAP